VLLVGLTGGIGSGKSTVARMLAERGAVILDADEIVRALQRQGSEVYDRIVARFGPGVVGPDGELDRAKLATVVFGDEAARADLNGIVHPEVWREISARLEELKGSDRVVVLDVPLLVEGGGGAGLDVVVVVEAGEEARIDRLARARGMAAEDVRARMAAQASPGQRRALADEVIVNDGSEPDLAAAVDALWARLAEKA
jgi:dephospho-CoA kinase